MRRLLPLLILLAFVAGCSNRERANPLDPANPVTGGRPAGFVALADFDVVTLSWTAQPELTIDGFRILRFAQGDSAWRTLADLLPPWTNRFLDTAVGNGTEYRYRIYYVIDGQLAHAPAEDVATPGALRPWVADAGAARAVRLTPDGRRVLTSLTDVGAVQSLAIDPVGGALWTSSANDGRVTVRTQGAFGSVTITGIAQPFTMSVDVADGSAWICNRTGSVVHYFPDGRVGSPGALAPFTQPSGVAVCAADRSVWICEHGANRVWHFDVAGRLVATAVVPAPGRVAVDSLTRMAWVTSSETGLVWRIGEFGEVVDSTAAALGPIGIALDRTHGRAWVADAAGDRVIALDLATLAVLRTVSGVPEARELDVDRASGDVWVVARAIRSVLRIGLDGTVRTEAGGFADPREIRVDPGTP